MRIKPILFSTLMVLAILDGRKTMTRRVVKFPDGMTGRLPNYPELQSEPIQFYPTGIKRCPYHPGDILWVRETWGVGIQASGGIIFKANFQDRRATLADGQKWRPSIFMPREAARIWLRVTDVRVERVQEISVSDAKDEGIRVWANGCIDGLMFGCYNGDCCVDNTCTRPIELFRELWDGINAKRGYSWDANPWVWVISFERCDKPQDVTP